MLIETSARIESASLAIALAKGVKYAKLAWLETIKVHMIQRKPQDGLNAWADANCIAGAFIFRVELKEQILRCSFHELDNARLAKGLAKLASVDVAAIGRIAANKATVDDCITLLQYALFGYPRF